MRTLITADLHFTDNPRDEYRFKVVGEIARIAIDYKATSIVVLGDLTEEKDRHSAWLTNAVVEALREWTSVVKVVLALKGNHDYINPDHPFFKFIDSIPRVMWINDPTEWNDWLCLPHTANYKKDWADLPLRDYNAIFAHNTFAGAVSESGKKLDGIPLDIFGRGSGVISGDVHKPQTIVSAKDVQLIYAGAPYTVDFGDDYDPRVLIVGAGSLSSVPVPGPQKRLVTTDWPMPSNALSSTLESLVLNKGDLLKIRVRIDAEKYARWAEIKREVVAWANEYKCIVHSIHPVVEQPRMLKTKPKRSSQRDDKAILREFAKRRQVDDKTLQVGLEMCDG